MKCIKNQQTNEIVRISNEMAVNKIKHDANWAYCPKSEWKKDNPEPRRVRVNYNEEEIKNKD